MQAILSLLIEPFRKDDQEEALACLKREGGLDHCSLAFYKEGNLGRRRRVGQLADRRAGLRVVLPRLPARPRLGQRGRRPDDRDERQGVISLRRRAPSGRGGA